MEQCRTIQLSRAVRERLHPHRNSILDNASSVFYLATTPTRSVQRETIVRRLTKAIVRLPGSNLGDGLTTVKLGSPVHERALLQHEAYCRALERCGLTVTRLEADLRYPDCTFVEDTAILTPGSAILTRPGAPSRRGEVDAMRPVLASFYRSIQEIAAPGTVDAGDVCEAGDTYFIGISARTNEGGARQLSGFLEREGFRVIVVDVRNAPGVLHLKSGLAHLGERRLAAVGEIGCLPVFDGYEIIRIPAKEEYAANCIRVNSSVLVAAGFPATERTLMRMGYDLVVLEMSEFRKMDGGLSCLSLRF